MVSLIAGAQTYGEIAQGCTPGPKRRAAPRALMPKAYPFVPEFSMAELDWRVYYERERNYMPYELVSRLREAGL